MALVLLAVLGCARSSFETGRLGRIALHTPDESPRGVVFLFSGALGWGATEESAASLLAADRVVVIGVDLAMYRPALDASDGECLYLLSEIESLSQQVQRDLALPGYFSPILAGIGEGGALARAALQQTPAATVAGSIAVDPTAAVRTRLPLCPGDVASKSAGGFIYGPVGTLPGFLAFGFTSAFDAAGRAQATSVIARGEPAVIEREPAAGSDVPAATLLAELVRAHLSDSRDSADGGNGAAAAGGADDAAGARGAANASTTSRTLSASLVELAADGAAASDGRPLVVMISGDGGWRDLDKTIAEYLRGHGANVVGWDSLRYFWHEKTPEELAADLDAVIRRYAEPWHASDVVLAGYSFGAGVLPFAYNRLPEATRAKVSQLSLLGFSADADFEIHISGWIGAPPSDEARPVGPELAQIAPGLIQCFYGEEEDDSLCPSLEASGAEIIRTAGDHHFNGDYDALAKRILDGIARRHQRSSAGTPANR